MVHSLSLRSLSSPPLRADASVKLLCVVDLIHSSKSKRTFGGEPHISETIVTSHNLNFIHTRTKKKKNTPDIHNVILNIQNVL